MRETDRGFTLFRSQLREMSFSSDSIGSVLHLRERGKHGARLNVFEVWFGTCEDLQ